MEAIEIEKSIETINKYLKILKEKYEQIDVRPVYIRSSNTFFLNIDRIKPVILRNILLFFVYII
jgi:hypothetical protein